MAITRFPAHSIPKPTTRTIGPIRNPAEGAGINPPSAHPREVPGNVGDERRLADVTDIFQRRFVFERHWPRGGGGHRLCPEGVLRTAGQRRVSHLPLTPSLSVWGDPRETREVRLAREMALLSALTCTNSACPLRRRTSRCSTTRPLPTSTPRPLVCVTRSPTTLSDWHM